MGEIAKRSANFGAPADSQSLSPGFNLPNDVFMYVFSKLPVNTILSCRCVCKQWRRLLYDEDFVKIHQHSETRNIFILPSVLHSPSFDHALCKEESSSGNFRYKMPPLLLDLPLEGQYNAEIIGCSHGLLCVSIYHPEEDHDYYKIVLWNPSTGVYKILPDADPVVCTFFHFDVDFMLIGFGYDSFSGDYKLVRVRFGPANRQVEVYSLKTNSWMVIESAPPRSFMHSSNPIGVAVNGSISWKITFDHRKGYRGILGFDFRDNKFTELQFLPRDIQGLCRNVKLRAMGECLGVYCYFWDANLNLSADSFVGLWMARKDDQTEEWSKLVFMSCREMGEAGELFRRKLPLFRFVNDTVSFYIPEFDWESERPVFVIYEPRLNKVVGTVPFDGISTYHNGFFPDDLVTYSESLVSPNAWGS